MISVDLHRAPPARIAGGITALIAAIVITGVVAIPIALTTAIIRTTNIRGPITSVVRTIIARRAIFVDVAGVYASQASLTIARAACSQLSLFQWLPREYRGVQCSPIMQAQQPRRRRIGGKARQFNLYLLPQQLQFASPLFENFVWPVSQRPCWHLSAPRRQGVRV